jgi:hypothetical protein
VPKSYCEPTTLWRLTKGLEVAKAVFVPHAALSTLIVFRNETVESIEDVREWATAIERAEVARVSFVERGWSEIG